MRGKEEEEALEEGLPGPRRVSIVKDLEICKYGHRGSNRGQSTQRIVVCQNRLEESQDRGQPRDTGRGHGTDDSE